MDQFRRRLERRVNRIVSMPGDETPRLFIHIPKTAGTSFRYAAEIRFGGSRVLRDYGPESDDTSQAIKNHVYAGGNPEAIIRALAEKPIRLVSGHFPLTKYREIFCLSDTATLVRRPVDQVISHYQHMVKHYGHQGGLMDFARLPQYQNVQSQYIGMLDPAMIGQLGLTESYRSFLEVLNEQWGWTLPHRRRNVGNRLGIARINLTREERFEIERLNAIDVDLYRRASHVFSNRFKANQLGVNADVRGGITRAAEGKPLTGWAFDLLSQAPVKVDILVDGEYLGSTTCDRTIHEQSNWRLPWEGQVGFTFNPISPLEGRSVEIRDSAHSFSLDSRQIRGAD